MSYQVKHPPVRKAVSGGIDERLAGLDVVVPYTNHELTQAALAVARRLGDALSPLIRLVRLQEVPYPLPVECPTVPASFLKPELEQLAGEVAGHVQICCVRDSKLAWFEILSCKSVIVLATRGRSWKTLFRASREERLARWMREHGYTVVLEYLSGSGGNHHA